MAMMILVYGASGATGRLLVQQLLDRGVHVKAVVRSLKRSPLDAHDHLDPIEASLSELCDDEIAELIQGCDAIASCLGHNMTWKGIYGPPRRLVTDVVRRTCEVVRKSQPDGQEIRFVLMNTAGNHISENDEPISFPQRMVLSLLRRLIPPHADNEQAGQYLRTVIGINDSSVKWVGVRPDTLQDADKVSAYEVHPSPTRSAIFNAGSTSRINVAHFMAELIMNDQIWSQWIGQFPVIYNRKI